MPAKPALVGAAVGYLSLWMVWWLFRNLTGKEGMGHGDFKLLAALGAWCGLKGILPIILLSSVLGAIIGSIWLYTRGRDRATPIPFGPTWPSRAGCTLRGARPWSSSTWC